MHPQSKTDVISAQTVTTLRHTLWQVVLNRHVSHRSSQDLYCTAVNQCLVYSLIADSLSCRKLLLFQFWTAGLASNRSIALHFLQEALNTNRILTKYCFVALVSSLVLKEWFDIFGNMRINFLPIELDQKIDATVMSKH